MPFTECFIVLFTWTCHCHCLSQTFTPARNFDCIYFHFASHIFK